jgi:AcrR family transcriptional regulator
MPRRSYHHGDLANALLDATETLVTERGIMGFSMREAARAVGVDPAACYRHFASREALLDAFAARCFAGFGAAMEREVGKLADRPAPDRLRVMGHAYLKFALAHPAKFRVMFGPRNVDVRVPIPGQPSAFDLLTKTVEDWGLSIPGTDAAQQAVVLWAGVHGLTQLILDGALPATAKERQAHMDAVVTHEIAGLLARAAKRPKEKA